MRPLFSRTELVFALACVAAFVLFLAGCAQFGLQRSTISFDRDETLLFYAHLTAEIREGIVLLESACAAKPPLLPTENCARLGQIRDQVRAAKSLFEAGVRAKREVSLQDLRGLLDVAALVGRFAGVPIPALPR